MKKLHTPATATHKESTIPERGEDSHGAGGAGDTGEVGDEGRGEEGEKEEGERKVVLLPRTSNTTELWPVILTKAIFKVAALEYVTHIPQLQRVGQDVV